MGTDYFQSLLGGALMGFVLLMLVALSRKGGRQTPPATGLWTLLVALNAGIFAVPFNIWMASKEQVAPPEMLMLLAFSAVPSSILIWLMKISKKK